MDLALKDKTAIVTGGASGIGLCTARFLQREGVRVLIADIQEETLKEAAATLNQGEVETFALDVRHYDACEAMVRHGIENFGHVDILINSAGISGPALLFVETGPEDWHDLIEINLIGVMNCCRAVTEHMIERGSGNIVTLASEAGKGNEKRIVAYGATKGGVISFTRGLAIELGRHNIKVNCVCPGVTHSPMTAYLKDSQELEKRFASAYPLGRLGIPEDIAPMIVFLCSDRTSWVTGQAISVSGGFGRS